MATCPMCGDDELVPVVMPAIGLHGAHCRACGSFWRRGTPIRLRFLEDLADVLSRHGLTWMSVERDPDRSWLPEAYRTSRLFRSLCPACREDDLEIKLVAPLVQLVTVCPHCDACWSENEAPSGRRHGLLGVYLQRQGLNEDDLVDLAADLTA